MHDEGRDLRQVLITIAADHDIDDIAILRDGWRRFEGELASAIGFARRAFADLDPAMLERSVDRLEAVGDLHRLLRRAPQRVRLDETVSELCLTLSRCAEVLADTPIEMELAIAAVDGRVAAAVNLIVVALLAGQCAGGPVDTGGHVELEVDLSPVAVTITMRDVASDPPDRRAVGGALLGRVLASAGATCEQWSSAGLATVRVEVPVADAMPLRTVGNA